jgi:hypothetical protein
VSNLRRGSGWGVRSRICKTGVLGMCVRSQEREPDRSRRYLTVSACVCNRGVPRLKVSRTASVVLRAVRTDPEPRRSTTLCRRNLWWGALIVSVDIPTDRSVNSLRVLLSRHAPRVMMAHGPKNWIQMNPQQIFGFAVIMSRRDVHGLGSIPLFPGLCSWLDELAPTAGDRLPQGGESSAA